MARRSLLKPRKLRELLHMNKGYGSAAQEKRPPLTWWRVESRSRIVKKRNNESDWELKDGNSIAETSITTLLLLSENEAPQQLS